VDGFTSFKNPRATLGAVFGRATRSPLASGGEAERRTGEQEGVFKGKECLPVSLSA